MILALDVGNTNIVIGCIEEGNIMCDGRMSTDHKKTADEYAIHFKMLLEMNEINLKQVEGAIISSVVPPVTNALIQAVQKITNITPLVVTADMNHGLNIKTDNPKALGADLIVDAVAAIHEYTLPLVVFDLGTATTCSVIDSQCNYLGGMIFPGIKVAAEALSSQASQLPYISLDAPEQVVGRNTIDCMKSGIIYGNAAMIDGMIERIETELQNKVTVVATGGLSRCIIEHCKKEIHYDNDLLLKGLWILYCRNN